MLQLQYSDLRAQGNQLSSTSCADVISQRAKVDAQGESMELTLNLPKIQATFVI